jgi:hypothetical protein
MAARFNFTTCCLITLLLMGCESARSKTDVGPRYIVPPGTGSETIDGVTYAYVAPAERQQAIISGYAQLKVGQTREEVRTLLGAPDYAIAMYPRRSYRFLGWHYIYHIRTIFNWTDTSDQWVQTMFDPSSDRLYWAHSNSLPGLADVGAHEP